MWTTTCVIHRLPQASAARAPSGDARMMTNLAALPFEGIARAVAISPDVVVSHRSAAQLWSMWTPEFTKIEITRRAGDRGSRYTTSVQRDTVVAHRRILGPDDVVDLHGLAVTSPVRTWLDLSAILGLHDLVAAGDSALRIGCSPHELAQRVAAVHHLRGSVRARRALPILDAASRSRPESRIRTALVLAGLPAPAVNKSVFDEFGQWLAEPDLHYLEAKLALEYNGSDHAGPARMRKDARRLLDLQRADWTVRTYTAIDAFARLDQVVADVRVLLHRLAPQLLVREHLRRRPLRTQVTTFPHE